MIELILILLTIVGGDIDKDTSLSTPENIEYLEYLDVGMCANLLHIPGSDLSRCDIDKTNEYIMNIKRGNY